MEQDVKVHENVGNRVYNCQTTNENKWENSERQKWERKKE